MRQAGIGRIATTGGAALLLLALAWPAAAAPDLASLSADDMRALQRILETERTNATRRLPSGLSVTVLKTQTSPRICRVFRIGRQGQEGQAVGCRIGVQRWALNGSIEAAQAAPAEPAPAEPVVRPKVVAQSQPVQNSEDEGVEEAGAAALARRAAPEADAGRAPAETQVAALPRAPFQAPRPQIRPRAPDDAPEPAAAGPTQAPVPRARPSSGGAAPEAAVAAPQPAAPAVVEIDPSLRVLASPPTVPRPAPRPGSAQPAAAAAPAAPSASTAAPAPQVAAAPPAPQQPESLINVPPESIITAPAVEALVPRVDAGPAAPVPFTVPPPRSRPEVAAARPAQGAAPPATRPPPGASNVPVPRRRPG
ncbi:hypothetical protein [Inquilinus limosus]|uniref:hypothetical protein n=1 Tax=Inquilinus limosus TaxID=171674 RepID=UPI000420A3E9|nr:hypothetical protein [Inquilinus limosus]